MGGRGCLVSWLWEVLGGEGKRKRKRGDLLCELVVGEGVGVGALAVEALSGELGVAFLLVGKAVFFALLALAGCGHRGGWVGLGLGRGRGRRRFVNGAGEEIMARVENVFRVRVVRRNAADGS